MFASQAVFVRRRLGALATVALLVLAVTALWPSTSSGAGRPRWHVVRPGETLWGIASAAYGGDPREHIQAVASSNGLVNDVIVPGERLRLP